MNVSRLTPSRPKYSLIRSVAMNTTGQGITPMLKCKWTEGKELAAGEFAKDRIGDEEAGQRQIDNIPAALSSHGDFPVVVSTVGARVTSCRDFSESLTWSRRRRKNYRRTLWDRRFSLWEILFRRCTRTGRGSLPAAPPGSSPSRARMLRRCRRWSARRRS